METASNELGCKEERDSSKRESDRGGKKSSLHSALGPLRNSEAWHGEGSLAEQSKAKQLVPRVRGEKRIGRTGQRMWLCALALHWAEDSLQ